METRLLQLLSWKQPFRKVTQRINEEFNSSYTEEDIKELAKNLRAGKTATINSKGFKILQGKEDYENGEKTLEVENSGPLNKEELEKLLRIDTKVSYIKMVWLKSSSNDKWRYSVLVINKPQEDASLLDFTAFLKGYKSDYTRPASITSTLDPKNTVVISLSDFHLDKQTLKKMSLEEKTKLYRSTLMSLITKAYRSFGLSKIIFVIGNDFFHTDNFHNQTTNGTPQDVSTSWFNAYEEGFKLLTWAITYLREYAPVHVVNIMSNHSRTKDFYLAHALDVYFSADSDITFDRTATHTKVVQLGNNFFGFHHGDTDVSKLPLYFASKYGVEWGIASNRHIFLGDKHHKKQYKFTLGNSEIEGVRVNYLPSLSDTDKWHELKGYDLAIRAGLIHIYDNVKGYVGEFEVRV